MSDRNQVYVYFDHDSESPERLGVISVQSTRGKEFFSFEFDKEWLRKHPDQILDPDLQLYAGPQFTAKSNFGIFMDSAPDRWGRKLILRHEALRARKAAEQPKTLQEHAPSGQDGFSGFTPIRLRLIRVSPAGKPLRKVHTGDPRHGRHQSC